MNSKTAKALMGLLLILTPLVVAAQPFPAKAVRLIVPYPPGGGVDTFSRALAQEIAKTWGQQLIVDNRPGANAIIGSEALAKSAPDGYTMFISDRATVVLNPLLYSKLPYDPNDLAPVIAPVQFVNVLTASRDLPVQTLQDFVALAKSKPGALNYGTLGIGSDSHLAAEAFWARADIKLTHVPYKGMTDVLQGLLGGQVQVGFSPVSLAVPLLRDGRIKVLVNGGTARSAVLPDVPTFAEAGFPGFEHRTWFGMFVPRNTPQAIIDKLAADIGSIVSDKAFSDRYIVSVGSVPLSLGPKELAAQIRSDFEKYRALVKTLNVRLD